MKNEMKNNKGNNKMNNKMNKQEMAEKVKAEVKERFANKQVEEQVTTMEAKEQEVKIEQQKETKKSKKQEQQEMKEAKKKANAERKMLHSSLLEKLVAEAMTWEGVEQRNTPDYIGLRVGKRMFAEISANTKFGRVLLAPVLAEETEGIFEGIELENTNGLRVRKAPKSFGWTLRDIFELTSENQLEAITHYLKLAYDNRMEMYQEKLRKEAEKEAKKQEDARKKAEKEAKEKAKKEKQEAKKQQEQPKEEKAN